MHQNGIENVVSASGTALTSYQINMIKRSTKNVVLLFDGDKAGIKATIRSIDLCLKAEMNVQIASFPNGEDPDSFSKKLSTQEFNNYLEKNAVNFVDYLIKIYDLNTEKDPGKIIDIKKKIISSISEIPEVFSREEYCRIYYKKLGISEQSLLKQVNNSRNHLKSSSRNFPKQSENLAHRNNPSKTANKLEKQEAEILRLLINYGNETFTIEEEQETVAGMIINELSNDNIHFTNQIFNDIYAEVISNIEENGEISTDNLVNNRNHKISLTTINLITEPHSISDNWAERHRIITERENQKIHKTTEKAILSLKKCLVDVQIKGLQKQIKNDKINEEEIKKLSELIKIKTQIAKLLGRNIG